MKLHAPAIVAIAIAWTASSMMTHAPTGIEAGKFVTFDGEGGDFQGRWNPETSTPRVRTYYGAAELSKVGGGRFRCDGYELVYSGGSTSLVHGGNAVGKNFEHV